LGISCRKISLRHRPTKDPQTWREPLLIISALYHFFSSFIFIFISYSFFSLILIFVASFSVCARGHKSYHQLFFGLVMIIFRNFKYPCKMILFHDDNRRLRSLGFFLTS
jgi:hypothetical protein